ncbi:MAG: DUF763 domain-containing protein, partial [Sulfolobales archaeon]
SGVADLPLHNGHVPKWLVPIMKRLAKAIMDIMYLEFGSEKILERLVNPLWFQALNNAIGMDWDSSGSTTVTLGILSEVLDPIEHEMVIVGGKGKKARLIPKQLSELSKKIPIDAEKYARISKLVASVDTTLLQDGYQLYHQSMIITATGKWGIIQQGMNLSTKFARRYHWYNPVNFVVEPHTAICGIKKNEVINLISQEVEKTRRLILDLISQEPRKTLKEYYEAFRLINNTPTLDLWINNASIIGRSRVKRLLYFKPVSIDKVVKVLTKLNQLKPKNLEEALLNGLGPSTTRALSLIADLIYNEPPSYEDPVNYSYDPFKYAYTIGGKDGIPFPIDRKVAEEVIVTLEDLITRAKLDIKDKNLATKRLKNLLKILSNSFNML